MLAETVEDKVAALALMRASGELTAEEFTAATDKLSHYYAAIVRDLVLGKFGLTFVGGTGRWEG